MSALKVYITDYDYYDNEIEKNILEPLGAEVIGLQCKDGKGLAKQAADADALMVQYAYISREIIEALPKLKVIARYGVGMDIIDVEAAEEKGIICTNVVDYCNNEVADHNISLLLMMLRRIPMFVKETSKGAWHWSETGKSVHRFSSLKVGVVGLGRISRNMCKKLQSLGFTITAHDPFLDKNEAENLGIDLVELDELCIDSDALVLQCPYNSETHHLMNEERFSLMKKDAVLVNCSRGKLVDNQALYHALKTGEIAAAGLDDLEDEPAKKFDWKPSENELFKLANCFITPHVAYYSEESLVEARKLASINVKAVLSGQNPPNKVI